MSKGLQATDAVHCPSCQKPQFGPAADYVIPGRTGDESRALDECIECYVPFSVLLTATGEYLVEVAEADD